MNFVSSRFMRLVAMLTGVVMLTACLPPQVKVNPTRTSLMATYAVAPQGLDGMVTTKTEECTLRTQISEEKARQYEADPALIVKENACREFDKTGVLAQLAVQGNQQLAGEITKSAVTAATGGLVNFAVQRALQREQGKICAKGGCIQTVNSNVNVSNSSAHADGGDAISVSESGAAAGASVIVEGSCPNGNCK